MRTLVRMLLAAFLVQVVGSAAPAVAQSQDNTAVAVNKKDGTSVFKLAFSVKTVTGEVDATNTAVAYASCSDCRTVAAAIQVVLVSGDVTSASVENEALAVNYQCSECETLAVAYQFVYGDGQELEFTKEGKRRLRDLKKQFYDLKMRDDLTLDELAVEIGRIAAEVAVVVDTEVQAKNASDPPPSGTGTTTTTASSGPSSSTTSTAPAPATTAPPVTTTAAVPTSSTIVGSPTTTAAP